jgi:zinc transporter ZupT
MGSMAPYLTWATLIGAPVGGVIGALLTKGMLSDVLKGVAAGGAGVFGYSLPEMIAPTVGRRAGSPMQLGGGMSVKMLPAGVAGAPARAATAVRVRSAIEI